MKLCGGIDPFFHLTDYRPVPAFLFNAMLNNTQFRNKFLNLLMDYGNEIITIKNKN